MTQLGPDRVLARSPPERACNRCPVGHQDSGLEALKETKVMTELHVWTYDSNDGDFYVAESAEEAAQMHREQMGNDPVRRTCPGCGGEHSLAQACSWVMAQGRGR